MELENLHLDIKKFIGDLSESNYKKHEMGGVKSFTFKIPKITIFFFSKPIDLKDCLIAFEGRYLSELEFKKILNLKSFW